MHLKASAFFKWLLLSVILNHHLIYDHEPSVECFLYLPLLLLLRMQCPPVYGAFEQINIDLQLVISYCCLIFFFVCFGIICSVHIYKW